MSTSRDQPTEISAFVEGTTTSDSVDQIGRFRIYLGAAPGVGKTFAMLQEGLSRRERGTDVVVGFVESHARTQIENLLHRFEVIPPKNVTYRGSNFVEMDLDAVLNRHPKVALVDELAHTNVPEAGRHEKRWQDIVELLDGDIDVITTMNIQHLESLAESVERIIEVPIQERVPDWLVRRADQIELVDSLPGQLRRRMIHGNIYPAEQVPDALAHYFRSDNLNTLRELSLRFLAGETEDQLQDFLLPQQRGVTWETSERILVGVTTAPGAEGIMRRAARMASRMKVDLQVLHVRSAGDDRRPPDERLVALRQLAADLGAEWNEVRNDDPAQALMDFAQQGNFTQVVVGSSGRTRWQELRSGGSVVNKLSRMAAVSDFDIHIIARRDPSLEVNQSIPSNHES